MLILSAIEKSYGGRVLFSDASLQVNRGDRIGLVGPNGAGKTTLFSLVLGEESADSGIVELQRGLAVGHLPQESAPASGETVLELTVGVTAEMKELWHGLNHSNADAPNEGHDLASLRRRFDELDGHHLVARAKQVLRGLGFRERDYGRSASTMSGGWVMRAHLARLLVQQPDLLLLDEPTNHLDLDALLWFQNHLKTYAGGILVISHDREFLNQLVDSVVEIRQSKLVRYRGNYDSYLEQREAAEEQWLAAYKNQQREIARLQRFVDRFRAKNTKAAQAQSKLKQIARMEKIEAPPGDDATLDFDFPQPERSGLKVIRLLQVDFGYAPDGQWHAGSSSDGAPALLYQGLDFEAERGQRVVLVGPNGAGKSTLLKLLAGVLTPTGGERRLGQKVRAGYYSQYRVDQLDPSHTVLEEAMTTPQRISEEFARTVLGCFLFSGDDVFKRVSVLSGGEKSRLALVKLLLDPPNLLLMDEPTTHLDIPSTEALLAALERFEGTILFISHDVYFIRELANHVVHVQDGRLTHYPGGYPYYLDKTAALRPAVGPVSDTSGPTEEETAIARERARRRREAEERQERSRRRQELKKAVQRLEENIHSLESRQKELTATMEDPATYEDSARAVDVNREFQENQARLHTLNSDWEVAATKLSDLETEP